jgi:hypothetical protein
MQVKLYITLNLADNDSPDWEDSDYQNADDAILALIGEMRYRVGHMPEGHIVDIEKK